MVQRYAYDLTDPQVFYFNIRNYEKLFKNNVGSIIPLRDFSSNVIVCPIYCYNHPTVWLEIWYIIRPRVHPTRQKIYTTPMFHHPISDGNRGRFCAMHKTK